MTAAQVTPSIADLVVGRVTALHQRYLAGAGSAVAQLAALRQAATAPPGSDPRVWELTVAGVSPAAQDDAPTRAEVAVHTAMTLFALHQQARSQPMHRSGMGLGRAVRQLGERTNPDAVRRRFEALGTAATTAELLHHTRGMVRQLRSAEVPLDYGALARDLLHWQDPARSGAVRLRWGRDYHRIARDTQTTTDRTDIQE